MDFRLPTASGQEQPPRSVEVPKKTGRMRSSCDNCHRSKIKCTGSNPCSACIGSQSTCTYSKGSRLGRPRGSKNKRTTSAPQNNSNQVEAQSEPTKVNADAQPWPAVDLTSFDPGVDHGCGFLFTDNSLSSPLLFGHNAEMVEPVSPKSRLDLQAIFAQNSNMFDSPKSMEYDSGSGTDNVTTPPNCSTMAGSDKIPLDYARIQYPVALATSDEMECSCLQQLIKLVYQLEDLRYSQAKGPAIDAVLEGVKLAEGPWKILMRCSQCRCKMAFKEASLLFCMSIRTLLGSLQKLSSGRLQPDFTSSITVSIGNFNLPEDAKTEVIETVIRKMLQPIAGALVHLWERTGKPRLATSADQGMIDVHDGSLTPAGLFTNVSAGERRQLASHDLTSAISGTKGTVPLLNMLEVLMKVSEEKLKTSNC